jgi:tRNA (guanine-N7-)-methyltransferase
MRERFPNGHGILVTMPRGRYPARLNVTPPDPATAARYYHEWPGRELYRHPERFGPLSSPALFGNNHPLVLDIGCAVGDVLCALAPLHRNTNFVGVDIVAKPLYRAVATAAAAGLPNLRFIHADIRLAIARVPDATLQTAYLHFPAPLLRNRQRRQRLVAPDLLTTIARALQPGGTLSFITDQPDLYAELEAILPGVPALTRLTCEQGPHSLSELLKSHYHRRWEARGRPILRLELVRSPNRMSQID